MRQQGGILVPTLPPTFTPANSLYGQIAKLSQFLSLHHLLVQGPIVDTLT